MFNAFYDVNIKKEYIFFLFTFLYQCVTFDGKFKTSKIKKLSKIDVIYLCARACV